MYSMEIAQKPNVAVLHQRYFPRRVPVIVATYHVSMIVPLEVCSFTEINT